MKVYGYRLADDVNSFLKKGMFVVDAGPSPGSNVKNVPFQKMYEKGLVLVATLGDRISDRETLDKAAWFGVALWWVPETSLVKLVEMSAPF